MPKITDTMTADHKRCDEMFALAEEAVSKGDWEKGEALFKEFEETTEQHFLNEETILFPAYSMKTNLNSVTEALMNEHMQMRMMIFEMGEAIKEKNQDQFMGTADTVLTMMQQHNRKEESKLYSMADSAFRGEVDELLAKMELVR